jgi:hypothetical protein
LSDSDGDGVCDALEVDGCTSSSACNYSASATDDDGSCTYAAAGYTCGGGCAVDSDDDGICDQYEVTGCQDPSACNYDPFATNAGYCDFPSAPYTCSGGCQNDSDNDGVCDENEVLGCTDPQALNYHPWITETTDVCVYESDFGGSEENNCPADLSNDGVVNSSDLLILLASFSVLCPN